VVNCCLWRVFVRCVLIEGGFWKWDRGGWVDEKLVGVELS